VSIERTNILRRGFRPGLEEAGPFLRTRGCASKAGETLITFSQVFRFFFSSPSSRDRRAARVRHAFGRLFQFFFGRYPPRDSDEEDHISFRSKSHVGPAPWAEIARSGGAFVAHGLFFFPICPPVRYVERVPSISFVCSFWFVLPLLVSDSSFLFFIGHAGVPLRVTSDGRRSS